MKQRTPEPRSLQTHKLEELILFVAAAAQPEERCFAVKLDKILFSAE